MGRVSKTAADVRDFLEGSLEITSVSVRALHQLTEARYSPACRQVARVELEESQS